MNNSEEKENQGEYHTDDSKLGEIEKCDNIHDKKAILAWKGGLGNVHENTC